MYLKNISVRIDEVLLQKLHIVSKYNNRSANKQIITLIKQCILSYENQYGEIIITPNKKDYSSE